MNGSIAPRLMARCAGLLYLVIMLAGAFGEVFVRGALIVPHDAAATAHNILASQRLYRLGAGADMVTFLCDVALAALLFQLLKPAGRTLALLAAFFRLAYSAIIGALLLTLFAPLVLLKADGLAAFTGPQLEALALLSLKLHDFGFNIALVFFGVHCLLIGILIARSRFLPMIIGALLAIAGVGYTLNSILNLLAPGLDLSLYLLLPGFVAEGGLTLWLVIIGLDAAQWRARAAASPAPA